MVAIQYIVCEVADFNMVDVGEYNANQVVKRIYLPITPRDGREQVCRDKLRELLPRGTPVGVRDPNYQYSNPIIADMSIGGTSVVKELVEQGLATLWNMPPE